MKILHFSHTGTPDNRIERYAYLQQKAGYEVFLAGEKSSQEKQRFPELHLFDGFYECPAVLKTKAGLYPYFSWYKKKFRSIYQSLKPDVLHAHDLIAAKACSDLNLPFIYDDHEYWSRQVRNRGVSKKRHRITNLYLVPLYDRWEKEVLENATAIMAVSETQAEDHRSYNQQVFTMPNFLTEYEIEQIPPLSQPDNSLNSVIIIRDKTHYEPNFINLLSNFVRNNKSFLTVIGYFQYKLPGIEYQGILPHLDVIKSLPKFHIGLLTPQKSSRVGGYYKYWSPNRVFLYAHCGVTPVLYSDMTFLRSCFNSYAKYVDSPTEIPDVLKETSQDSEWLKNQPRLLQSIARKEMVWDKNGWKVDKAYQLL